MKLFFGLISFLFLSQAYADLERWQKWEVERNDLQLNSSIYHQLPSKAELSSYQTETLYVLEIDPGKVDFISAKSLKPEIFEKLKTADGKIKFYIHPKATELFKELISQGTLKEVSARPTTSPRTFFVDDLMVKVSLPQKINGAIRTVYPLQMSRATAINDLLSQASGFHFLPEPLAFYDKTPNSPFGFIVREIPATLVKGSNTLVPLLSYVAKHSDGSLLEKEAALRGVSAEHLVLQEILPSLLEAFIKGAQHGVALEMHQQNTLLEIDQSGKFTGRIFYRDLDGARVDFELRKKLGFKDETLLSQKDAAWIFDLENLQKMRSKKVPGSRPQEWSPVMETAFQTYLVGSSFDILKKKLKSLNFHPSFEQVIKREFKKTNTLSCQRIFL
ncbi:IucA/IucC family protein [Bdellovibrio svalbardensis]|uniref:Aerobactin siderophore biosynthesis IucA/IucC N-terminal domain-containing protein n=1 Tax=Bdellovibrio svalbardensis TaxID=2972972 RepID=A0ABT6DNC9_9BACT|nr:IucA/IucC family protein [Bdellovibrio svalbardensis]MDG0816633.1 hypothetical protein [Bdellovibrio svalbardensis]